MWGNILKNGILFASLNSEVFEDALELREKLLALEDLISRALPRRCSYHFPQISGTANLVEDMHHLHLQMYRIEV